MKYKVRITENLEREVETEADSQEEAEALVETAWKHGEYVLDAEDFVSVDFQADEVQEQIKVLFVQPGKVPEVIQMGTNLEDMQDVVGGDIEMYQPFEDDVAIICNENGKMDGLALNRAVYDASGRRVDIMAGDFFICNAPITSETFESLTDEQIQKYEKMFHSPERFYQTMSGIRVEKMNPKRNMER